MSPVKHAIRGRALAFTLEDELRIVREQLAAHPGRVGRTLAKTGALRATLVGLGAGGELRPHKADGPISVHVLEGAVELDAEGSSWTLPAGSLFVLEPGVVHAVRSEMGGIFLLTLAASERPPLDDAPAA